MRILALDYTLKYNSLDIYIAGCSGNPHCKGCHNPESWNFDKGDVYNKEYLSKIESNYIIPFDKMIKNIFVMGGEPLDHPLHELLDFLLDMKSFDKNIWLFTRYELGIIPMEVIKLCDYIKTGKYIPNLDKVNYFGIELASSNQKVLRISDIL